MTDNYLPSIFITVIIISTTHSFDLRESENEVTPKIKMKDVKLKVANEFSIGKLS